MLEDASDMAAALRKTGLKLNRDIVYYKVLEGVHNEDAWGKRFDKVLQFMVGKDESSLF